MRFLFLLLITLDATFAADPAAIKRNVTALIGSADRALAANQNSEAEERYKAALVQCGLLPPAEYHCKTNVLWKLARFYSQVKNYQKTEALYKERLEILLSKQRVGARPDLDLGIALFDLQSVLEAESLTDPSREAEGTTYMERAKAFYENCKVEFPDMRPVCDRRLADVEGMHGSILILKKRPDEAAPFLKAVTDRPDSGVRKEIMVIALRARAAALMAQGSASEAQEFLQRARQLDGGFPRRLLGAAEPEYTEAAKKAGIEGTVTLEIDITDSGGVTNVHVVKSLDAGLDENCARAVQQWRFDGKATQALKVECNFRILEKKNPIDVPR